ncbi:MAG: S-layer homology domain-containing protein, partial [Oscillospiraceae bacterium]|nr:S-layer homology domain-containing protein [Oscillospiraceae bacterium]
DKFRLSWDAATNTATLTIREFKPDAPELYTYGDVLMAELITDRKTGVNQFMDWNMVYQPVSTGFAVIADQDYVPTTFNYDVNIAEMLDSSIEGTQDDEGGGRRANFGQFPWFGAITAAVKVFTYYSSVTKYKDAEKIIEDLEEMGGDDGLEGDDAELMETAVAPTKWTMSALVVMKDTYYNGCRIMVGVAMTTGNGSYQKRANPFRSARSSLSYLLGGESGGELIYDFTTGNSRRQNNHYMRSEFGGRYITFSVYVGFYLDFGYIEIMDEDGDGYDISHDLVFMGAGGFVGAQLTGGCTWYIFPWGIPLYANLEAYLNVTLFLGSEADPSKTLEKAYYDNDQQTGEDWAFNLEVDGQAGVKLTLGAGFAKVLSVRATGGLGLHAGYSLRMSDWFPDLTGANTLSYATDAMFSGGVDTPFGSYDLWSASWPLPWGYGWLQYFQQMTRANNLIHFIKQNIDEDYVPDEYKAEAKARVDELAAYVDQYSGDGPTLRKKVNALQSWARGHHALGLTESRRVDAIRMGGLVGNIMEAAMLTGDEEASDQHFHVNDHVDSEWVADDASLMAAFGPVESRKLMDNAPSQPASQIIALGGNRFLVAFLDDDTSRERQQAYTLKYTVYDANAGTWTQPRTIQDDGTADSQANLVDAGDKIIVSWTSVKPEKLAALKDKVAAELKQKTGYTAGASEIEAALESDPARLLELMDVFTAQFDKSACTLGPIEQLTDDEFYDAGPQAVYDNETGDYIILYTKTSQSRESYGSAGDRLENMISGNPDDNTYSIMAYMLYNNQTDAVDTKGNTHEPGWARDYYFPKETDSDLAIQDLLLSVYGGQRFMRPTLRAEDGGQVDMPISDLTVARGYNGLAAYAFTVDKDYNLDTNDDRDLFVQFYRFSDHSTYVPIKVAGEEENYVIDRGTAQVTGTTMKEVGVGQPKLIRSGGSTWLFWRQADEGLYYLNISELLNAEVAVAPEQSGDGEWFYDGNTQMTYAVQADGSFAIDGTTGKPYQPDVRKVDFGSALTDGKLTATDYQVITDKDDNLYVVWNDTGTYQAPTDDGEVLVTYPTLGIYATAMIKEQVADEDEEDGTADLASWSKPFLMTRDHTSNDGIAIALDESDGSLIVVHNQYEMLYADTEEKQIQMVEKGLAGIQVNEEEEKAYFVGYPFYPSEISLMLTRFAPIGSVEATQFVFSDDTPVAGQTVAVAAAVENTGLTTAEGCDIAVYEYKDGKRGREIYSTASDEPLRVNTAKKITFDWTIPADGPEGYCLQTVIREKKAGGGYYDAIENYSEPFTLKPAYEPELEQCVQNGDSFDVRFHVTNTGNAPAPEGTSVNLFLQALHGDLKERYGMDDDTLVSVDISGLAPGETTTVVRSVTLPVSVFRFCGYDAVTVSVLDKDEEMLATTDQELIALTAPINLKLNGGKSVNVAAGKTVQAVLTYDSTVFMDTGVLYAVADPSIASVDAEGNVTGLADGVTTLTATIMPSGRTKRVQVQVGEGCKKDSSCPISRFTDASPTAWYHDGVHWALAEGVMNGVSSGRFAPDSPTSRAMIVTMLYRMEGEPRGSGAATFKDVPAGQWYTEAVNWAFANGIVNGYSAEKYGPDDNLTREQLVTILERYAKYKGMDVSKGEEAYLTGYDDAGIISDWAVKAFRWAVDAGIIQGVTDTRLSPQTSATRAQVATMLMRYNDLK